MVGIALRRLWLWRSWCLTLTTAPLMASKCSSSESGSSLVTSLPTDVEALLWTLIWTSDVPCFFNGSIVFTNSLSSFPATLSLMSIFWYVPLYSLSYERFSTITFSLQVKLVYHTYSCLFGTFACNNIQERVNEKLYQNTISLWAYMELERNNFTNYLYFQKGEVCFSILAVMTLINFFLVDRF